MNCPLCKSVETSKYYEEKNGKLRLFHRCNNCELIFLDPSRLLTADEEKSRYENHNNSERTPGYENFLMGLYDEVEAFITPKSKGLDYGCGPYPMMVEILNERGIDIIGFDPHFYKNQEALERTYDYILVNEVIEHVYDPAIFLRDLVYLVKSKGIIGIQTGIMSNDIDFSKWYYKEDETHVVFFSMETLEWIEENFPLEVLTRKKNVIVLRATT